MSSLPCPLGFAAFLWLLAAAPSSAAVPGCAALLAASDPLVDRQATVGGTATVSTPVTAPAGGELLVQVAEQGVDVLVEVRDATGRLVARADNPVRRTGSRYVIALPPTGQTLSIAVAGKEHAGVAGSVRIRAYATSRLTTHPDCVSAYRLLAAADTDYATGQQVSRARQAAAANAAREAYQRAVGAYASAAGAWEATGDRALQGEAQLAVAAANYQDLQEWQQTADAAIKAVALFQAVPDPYARARSEALLAASWIEQASQSSAAVHSVAMPAPARVRFSRARKLLGSLERFHLRRGELYDAVLQRNNIGVAYSNESRYRLAITAFQQASVRFAKLNEVPRQGLALQNVALAQWGLGDPDAAARTFALALEKLGPEPYPQLYLGALTNSALVNFSIGNVDTALRLDTEALDFSRKVQSRVYEGQSLYGLGIAYYALGDAERAGRYLQSSLALRSPAADPRGRVVTLRALASLYCDQGQHAAALAADEEALSLATTATSRGRMLVRIAGEQADTGQFREALTTIRTVISDHSWDPGIRAQALMMRGHILRLSGDYVAARPDLTAALSLGSRGEDLEVRFRAALELASTLDALHRDGEALHVVDLALARSAELRRQTANPELRAQRQEALRPAYDLKLALLAARYRQLLAAGRQRDAERVAHAALATAERQRAQSQADVSALQFSPASRRRMQPLLDRRERLYHDLAARRFRLEQLEDRSGGADVAAVALRAEVTDLRRELDSVNADVARVAGVRQSAGSAATGSWPGRLRQLARPPVLVEYWLGAEEAYAWTVTAAGIRWYLLGRSAPIIEAARDFHDALQAYATRPLKDRTLRAAVLYDRILRPLGDVAAPGQPIIVVAEGALSYVPFAALRTGHEATAEYLVQHHDIAVAPAVWWLMAPQPAVRPERLVDRVLLVSDPIYGGDDPRLRTLGRPAASPAADLQRLPWTAREAAMIAALSPPGLVDQFSGAMATRQRLLAIDWSRYRLIHLATHGVVDAGVPQLSALMLGAYDEHGARVDQALRAADLSLLHLNADVLALSACETALGREVAGEGAVGLAYTALARGARTVLGSLWSAPDEMSAQVMTGFYRGILQDRLGPAVALGAAMRAGLQRTPQADPALWAAFQLSTSHL